MKNLIKSSIAAAVLAASFGAQAAVINFADDFSLSSAKVEDNVVGGAFVTGAALNLGSGVTRTVGVNLVSATNGAGVAAPNGTVVVGRTVSAVAGPAWSGSAGSMDGSADPFLKAEWLVQYDNTSFVNSIGDFKFTYLSDLTATPVKFELYSGGSMVGGPAKTLAAQSGTVTFEILSAITGSDLSLHIYSANGGGDVSISGVSYVGSTPSSVPVPTTLALSGLGLVALGLGRRRASK